jgi:hypothetical protein
MIEFSRHAKRRMKLYGISEKDVLAVIEKGKKEESANGKIVFVHLIARKFKYPIKVVASHRGKTVIIVTTYPVKRGKKQQ